MTAARRFVLIVGTSGSGKGTIIAMLKDRHPEFLYPVSLTTREPRPGEEDGVTYHFVTKARFEEAIAEGELLEWAINHEKEYYGLLKAPVVDALAKGQVVVREMSFGGVDILMKSEVADQILSIFLMPPSLEVVKERILKRSALSNEEVARRLKSALDEMQKAGTCDVQIVAHQNMQEEIYREMEQTILDSAR